ncbi:MAG: hypothetical protein AAF998_05560 [Bacteroidota bacterium]
MRTEVTSGSASTPTAERTGSQGEEKDKDDCGCCDQQFTPATTTPNLREVLKKIRYSFENRNER